MTATNARRPPLSNKEAAAYTNLNEGFLNKTRVYGGGPDYIKVGARVLYDPDDLDAWLEARKRRSTSQTRAA